MCVCIIGGPAERIAAAHRGRYYSATSLSNATRVSSPSRPTANIDRLSGHAREAAAQVVRSGYIESGVRFTPEDEKIFASFIGGGTDFQQLVEHFNGRIAGAGD